MKTFSQKLIAFTSLAVITCATHAVPVTFNYTADNIVQLQLNCIIPADPICTSGGSATPLGPNQGEWWNTDNIIFDLAAGDYMATFLVANEGGPAGLLADISDGTSTLLTSTEWEVSSNSGLSWVAATSHGTNGDGPWGLRPDIDSLAEWIWTSEYHDGQQIWARGLFTVTDNVAVPEPGSLALLGFGLVGLGMIRRRKA